ncbi:phosphatase and actin regulator 2 isoform X3 [Oenanthe melanoleuca]|uniref:phosphatase and actin regulator 2 isoform X3 n=1 Tax=Oenanthe melanoleuca TaxID=2939378 RepID=UPI0024C12C59|nr:phosphatase and actin regulator 2 isoform X3 [Oenanthe melanoleuca]
MAERPGSSGTAPLPVWSLPGPRGRSQSDISSFSSSRRTCLLRSNVGGSVDGLDKASIANSDGPAPGSQTPPFKRKGKLSNIGKIFKPWKWRKKKTSDKFRETSAVLERKISTRQSREELIRRGVLKEMPEQDGDVTVNFETSNGHTIAIGEETIQEENIVKASGNNGTLSEKASEGKTEDQKAGSSHAKKLPVSKSSSSPSPSSTSSHHKATKETSSKSGTSGTPRGKKKPGKQSAPRTAPDGAASSPPCATADSLEAKAEKPKPEQTSTVIFEMEKADQPSKLVVPPPPSAAPPPPPLPPPFPAAAGQPAGSSGAQDVSDSCGAGPRSPGSDTKPLLQPERGADSSLGSAALGSAPDAGDTESLATKEDQEGEAPDQAFSELVEEPSDAAGPPESESSRESHGSDSDSDGPILYTDDDDDDDDDDENASTESSLASKIRRRDTLAIKLGNRPSKKELEDKNILQRTSEEERQEIRHQIGTKLVRRLSQRPTTEELEQRNILKQKNEEEEQEAKREIKRRLSRKLSLRPTVAELQARRILRFNEYVEVTESPDYDRRADKPWARLTPADKAAIRKELNEFKSTEMEVHEESRQFTRFHRP